MSSRNIDIVCKFIIIGDSAVGKTCLMKRFTNDEFSECYVNTLGLDYNSRYLEILGKRVQVQIWDTAGQEKYDCITKAYYRGSDGVIITYDITNRESFEHVVEWVYKFKKQTGGDDVERMLIGNKCDLEDERMVDVREGKKIAGQHGMRFNETSAKNGMNVNETFIELINIIVAKRLESIKKAELEEKNSFLLMNEKKDPTRKPQCCGK